MIHEIKENEIYCIDNLELLKKNEKQFSRFNIL